MLKKSQDKYQSTSETIKMKAFITFFGIIVIAAAQEPEACAVCRQGTGALFAALNSDESLTRQEQLIIDEGCPYAPDLDGCTVGVLTWWRRMAAAIYTENAAAIACHALENSCELPSYIE